MDHGNGGELTTLPRAATLRVALSLSTALDGARIPLHKTGRFVGDTET